MTFRERLMLACIGVLVAACTVVFTRYGTYQFCIRNYGWDNAWTQAIFADNEKLQHYETPRTIPDDEVPLDWAARYPFEQVFPASPVKESQFKELEQHFHEQARKFELWTNQRFYAYMPLVESMRWYQGLIGWNVPIYSDPANPAKLPNGHLTSFLKKQNVSHPIQETAALAAFCQENGIQFLVALAPNNNARGALYDGTLDFSNENGDAYLAGLETRGIQCLDLRPLLDAQSVNHMDLFFKTDHHWKPNTVRAAVQAIARTLNASYGYHMDVSLLDAGNFHEDVYPARYLGSFGQRLTLSRVQPDDFPLIYPNFPVTLRLQIPSMQLDRTGDFSIFYDYRQLAVQDFYQPLYGTYTYGERALVSVQNPQKKDQHKLLLVRDSFGNLMIPLLALGTKNVDAIDMRFFTGSLRAYLRQERPDTVLLCYTITEFNLNYSRIFYFD